MELGFDKSHAINYTSASQKVRVLTEQWVDDSIYCPNCGCTSIDKYPNNQPVADFYCSHCNEDYELKSQRNRIAAKIVDGAYRTMIDRLESNSNPNLFLLSYDLESISVKDFYVIPKHFFVPEMIEKRNPLSPTARRAGWIGCNILLHLVPQAGKIFIVRGGAIEPKDHVMASWQKTMFLRDAAEPNAKGWLLDVMRSIEDIGKQQFRLEELYAFEDRLGKLHPNNRHIKEKIRQQLQTLRDKGYLDFVSRGYYRLT